MSIAFPLKPVTLSKKEIMLVWHDLFLVNPCWLQILQVFANWMFYTLLPRYGSQADWSIVPRLLLFPPFKDGHYISPSPVFRDLSCRPWVCKYYCHWLWDFFSLFLQYPQVNSIRPHWFELIQIDQKISDMLFIYPDLHPFPFIVYGNLATRLVTLFFVRRLKQSRSSSA